MENYEQKYKEALGRAKEKRDEYKRLDGEESFVPSDIEYIFPELKESEDERIKKEIICYLNREITLSNFGGNVATFKKWIAWLENQNKQNFWEKCKHCEYFDGYDLCLHKKNFGSVTDESKENCKNNNFFIEKQLEQKSAIEAINEEKVDDANKVESKFKVDDWIINSEGMLRHIIDVTKTGYQTDNGWLTRDIYEREFHLWTIEDAKDGDVLHSTGWNNDCIFIFKGIDRWIFDETNRDKAVATGYCCLFVSSDKMELGLQGPDCIEVNIIKPATKIQRDLLFEKMEKAGYKWDNVKKELNKYEC